MKTNHEEDASQIREFFKGTTVFLTGATGFLGRLITEKLLRTCSEIETVYVMVRAKKQKSMEQRYEEVLANVLFDRVRREQPKFADKIRPISGDCALPDLGLRDADKRKLIDEVHCIFHCAATVRFDEKIRNATNINIRATRDLLLLASEIKQLKSFVYVSTAFSNCVRKDIAEEFYPPHISGEGLIKLVGTLNEDLLDSITPTLIRNWPNTYAFTKAIAEEVVMSRGKSLPVAIVRPSIVIATSQEPVPGWIDNVYGATGVLHGVALGLIRTLHCDANLLADMVPADFVINCTIAASWQVGTKKESNVNKQDGSETEENHANDDVQIFNYVSSPQQPISWRRFTELSEKYLKRIPSPLIIWHYCFIMTPSYFLHMLLVFFLHKIPAYVVDCLAFCVGKKAGLVKGYQKIDKFLHVLSYFATQQWSFRNENTQALFKQMTKRDQSLFNFDMETFDWDPYFQTYAVGGRIYLIKDPLDTLPQGLIKYRRLMVAHYTLVGVLSLGLLYAFWILFHTMF